MITIKELSIDNESAEKIIDLIKKHEPKIWNVLKVELKQLTLTDVVVPKGTLCECKKHSLKTNYGFDVCTKCGNEFDDQHNALQRLEYEQQGFINIKN